MSSETPKHFSSLLQFWTDQRFQSLQMINTVIIATEMDTSLMSVEHLNSFAISVIKRDTQKIGAELKIQFNNLCNFCNSRSSSQGSGQGRSSISLANVANVSNQANGYSDVPNISLAGFTPEQIQQLNITLSAMSQNPTGNSDAYINSAGSSFVQFFNFRLPNCGLSIAAPRTILSMMFLHYLM